MVMTSGPTMAAANELLSLIDHEIPDGRKSLQENYINLENVAKYCEDNYYKASSAQKPHALQETQNYTTHSLASVAYQINNLATNFMKLLDLQLNQLTDMESSVHHLNQMVMIHKEKVARREIGILTIGKSVPGHIGMKNGIIYPEQVERPIRYTRKSIDYTALDDVGHGVRQQGTTPRAARSPSVCSTSSSNITTNNQAAANKPPSTPVYQAGSGGGSISRGSNHYLTPAPVVAPPTVPSTPQPQAVFARSTSRQGNSWIDNSASALPPPEDFPGPYMGLEALSPPLPPPPGDQPDQFNYMGVMPQSHDFSNSREGPPSTRDGRMIGSVPEDTYGTMNARDDPYAATGAQLLSQQSMIPQNYLEKVVAIYDYQATKPDELTFAENAVIYVVNKNDDGWWEGTVDGQTGLFPYNYVEPCM